MESNMLQTTAASAASFWKTNEGKWGKGIAVILGAAALVGLYFLLPTLITLASNLITLTGLLLVLGTILYMAFDTDIRNAIFFAYKSFVRTVRKRLINTDPIAIIKVYIDFIRTQFDKLEKKIRELSGARTTVGANIEKLKDELDTVMSQLDQGVKKKIDPRELEAYNIQAGRVKDMITRFQATLTKLTMMNNVLNEMRKACKIVIMDKENQIRMLELERSTMQTATNAWTSAVSILKGDPNKKYFYDEAVSAIETDISTKKGIIEQYMVETEEIMTSINMQNGVLAEKGQKLLEKWQKDGVSALLTDGGMKASANLTSAQPIQASYAVVDSSSESKSGDNKYKSLLK